MNKLLCTFVLLAPLITAQDKRPNILFCIADDWSWAHAGAYGDTVIKTPTFDAIASRGMLFEHSYCASPSCTPSRGAILTGQHVHRLAEAGSLHSHLPKRFVTYPDLLEKAGYVIGFERKGWSPGRTKPVGRDRNPAGPRFKNFTAFLAGVPEDKTFCYWFGSVDPHRGYAKGSGIKSGMNLADVVVPPFLPDTPAVRSDILDYYFEVQRFDREVGEMLALLKAKGQLENTLVVMTSDNGMPFPRAKANLYDAGTRMPFAVQWPGHIKAGQETSAFMSFADIAPTFLEAAGLDIPKEMSGRSLLSLFSTGKAEGRDRVFVERERHAYVRKGNQSYPSRGIRTERFLYLHNYRPDRWPGGDPEHIWSVGIYGDCDNSPSKAAVLKDRDSDLFRLAFAKRPADELYDLSKDPWQLHNVATDEAYAKDLERLQKRLLAWQRATKDPRVSEDDDRWDAYPYYGGKAKRRKKKG